MIAKVNMFVDRPRREQTTQLALTEVQQANTSKTASFQATTRPVIFEGPNAAPQDSIQLAALLL
jgi:hypothetical protein